MTWGGAAAAGAVLAACVGRKGATPPVRVTDAPATTPATTPTPRWVVAFEDTFDTALDGSVWTAADYGGNRDLNEQQYNDPSMVAIEGGNLVLHASERAKAGYPYVAGAVSTKDKLTLGPYGRLTTKQLLGPGHGLGVGVCLYGQNIDAVGWPACGEIDATEIAMARPGELFASVHGPGYSGGNPISATRSGESLVDRWAEHTLTWEPGRITWALDSVPYQVAESTDPRAAAGWPFDQPFFLTVVMTVGSHLSGPVDTQTWPRSADGATVEPYAVFDFIRFEQPAA